MIKICSDCGRNFETQSQFRSVCPRCSEMSYRNAGFPANKMPAVRLMKRLVRTNPIVKVKGGKR